ncbi:MAG TPA: hypothetical protein VHY77_05005 [Acidimicrobiales bacterium]|nr:hypothetical protein [Acidimicrobiales bacterium]
MPRAYMTPDGHARVSLGFFGTLVVGFLYVMGALLFLGLLLFIAAAFLVAIVVALTAHGIERILVAMSPKWRARRVARGRFDPMRKVIETTATTTRSAQPRLRR